MSITDKTNQNLMKLIKGVHSLVVSDDLDRNRQSQDSIGKMLGTKSKEAAYTSHTIDGVAVEIVSINRPHSREKVIFYCHGGGFFTGSLHYARLLTTKLAGAASTDVISFDYRLAPESPFPAALEDTMKVWDALMLRGYSSKDIIIMGDSAGGNLALAMGLKLKEEGRFLPRGFVCMSPWTDLTCQGITHVSKADLDPILTEEYLNKARHCFTDESNFSNPLVSPLFGDYTGFPPVYIQVGENEILLSDSTLLYEELIKQGVTVSIDRFKGLWHVFQMSNHKIANDAIDKIAEFVFTLGD